MLYCYKKRDKYMKRFIFGLIKISYEILFEILLTTNEFYMDLSNNIYIISYILK